VRYPCRRLLTSVPESETSTSTANTAAPAYHCHCHSATTSKTTRRRTLPSAPAFCERLYTCSAITPHASSYRTACILCPRPAPRPGLHFRLQYSLFLALPRDSTTTTPTLYTWILLIHCAHVLITTGRPISETKRYETRRNEPANPPALHTPTSARTAAGSRRTNHHQ
jgi:hypothetical protein